MDIRNHHKFAMAARGLLAALVLIGITAFATSRVLSQEPDEAKAKPAQTAEEMEAQKKMQEMMETWMKYATPGKHHEYLKPMLGKWVYEGEWRMGPDAPYQKSGGKAVDEWMLDGRWMKHEAKGDPSEFGMFEGMGLLGYDNFRGKYVSMWVDNMSTVMMISEGTCDSSGKVITLVGSYMDPVENRKKTSRMVYKIESDEKFTMDIYEDNAKGKEYHAGKFTYVKKG